MDACTLTSVPFSKWLWATEETEVAWGYRSNVIASGWHFRIPLKLYGFTIQFQQSPRALSWHNEISSGVPIYPSFSSHTMLSSGRVCVVGTVCGGDTVYESSWVCIVELTDSFHYLCPTGTCICVSKYACLAVQPSKDGNNHCSSVFETCIWSIKKIYIFLHSS